MTENRPYAKGLRASPCRQLDEMEHVEHSLAALNVRYDRRYRQGFVWVAALLLLHELI